MIKILLISNDVNLKFYSEKSFKSSDQQIIIFNSTKHPLDIMSNACSLNPSILILDDDFIEPNSEHLLNSIKKVNPKLSIIFITSNTSLNLGRNINSIGVKHYLMKPITENEFTEVLKSLIKEKSIITY